MVPWSSPPLDGSASLGESLGDYQLIYMISFRFQSAILALAYHFTNLSARRRLRDRAKQLSVDPSNLSEELGLLEPEGLFRVK